MVDDVRFAVQVGWARLYHWALTVAKAIVAVAVPVLTTAILEGIADLSTAAQGAVVSVLTGVSVWATPNQR